MKTRRTEYRTHLGCLVEQTKRLDPELGRLEVDIVLSGPRDLDNVAQLPRRVSKRVARDFFTGSVD